MFARFTKAQRDRALLWLAHVGSLLPLALLIIDFFTRNLTANPIQAATLRTGKAALVLLVLSLACTPLVSLFRFTFAGKLRKPFGLYAFMYAGIHFLIFIWVDLGLNWAFIKDGFLNKPFAMVGFAAFLVLLPLAATSFRSVQKRMGRSWKRLHRLVYLAGLLVIWHYYWLVKSDVREPILWGILLVFLLLTRIKHVKKPLTVGVDWLKKRLNRTPGTAST